MKKHSKTKAASRKGTSSSAVKGFFDRNPLLKDILQALAVIVFGFILLNVAFIFDAVYQGTIRWIIGLFTPMNQNMDLYWFPPLMHGSFVVVIGIISWFILKSKLSTIYKAIYTTVPLATIFVTTGMFLYRWPAAVYILGIALGLGVLYYLKKTKQPWIYYFSLFYIGILLLIVMIAGVEI